MASYEPAPRIMPVPPGPSLLTSAQRVPGTDWRSGIRFATGCQRSSQLPYCPVGVDRNDADVQGVSASLPFWVYTPLACDIGSGTVNLAELDPFANALNETHTASGIAETLWMGTGYDALDDVSPTLRNSAVDVSGGGVFDLDDGVAQLLVHYERGTGGEGGAMVHIPSALGVYALGGGAGGARICWPEGTLYRGPFGSTVVLGPGYPNGFSPGGPFGHGPGDADDFAGNEAGQAWIYVTGPVEYDVTPVEVVPDDAGRRMPLRTNRYELWGQRQAIVRFDPCKVFATMVTNPAPLPEVS